jgi:spore maturation protein CgeB
MRLSFAVFGQSITSSWGRGHATLWRGLCRALSAEGHRVVFFERDVPSHARNRDLARPKHCELVLYERWDAVLARAEQALRESDVAIVTSSCPDALAAAELVFAASRPRRLFYDLDAPATLERVAAGEPVPHLDGRGLEPYDLVLSVTGGGVLQALEKTLGAKRAMPLYGGVDPELHRPATRAPIYAGDLSYLGTYAEDRQEALGELFLEPARRLSSHRFVIGGAQYPPDFPWLPNVWHVHHVAPRAHAAFYSSSRFTLNVTRRAMRQMGFCPSARLFEAAACGAPVVTDAWAGIERFFEPDKEILVMKSADDVMRALSLTESERARVAAAARARALREHTAQSRARELVDLALSAR